MKRLARAIPKIKNMDAFLWRVSVRGLHDCWPWEGCLSSGGYGQFSINGKYFYAHRVSFKLFKGKINRDKVIDHKCMNRKCVNPLHLREVDLKTNTTENSGSLGAVNKKKTHCKRGHEFTDENTYILKNGRQCRSCVIATGKIRDDLEKKERHRLKPHLGHKK